MPKIDVNEKLFFNLLGETFPYDILEDRLTCAKAELDEKPDSAAPENERIIKIELNDTNRPDLWSTAGLARQLKLHKNVQAVQPSKTGYTLYNDFLSFAGSTKDYGNRVVNVDPALKDIRPFMTAFVISGKPIDEPMLLDIIQTQEKLCWNFGRKRRSISMGVYRYAQIKWPVSYHAVDPDNTSFVPLGFDKPMSCRQIVTEHPKGKEYGHIIADMPKFPLLSDASGNTLSMAPIINSAALGAVQVGDSDLLVEMTGTDMPSLLLATMIVACDFFDAGYKILPCLIKHPYDTGFGKDIVTPLYFQSSTSASVKAAQKLLGENLSASEMLAALARMGVEATEKDGIITIMPPPYRNDFLHEVDVIEDIMLGRELPSFKPEKPRDFTIGRLTPLTLLSRKAKSLMIGLGYQEMIFNYLGSKRDYIERMNIDGADVIEVSNPMSENYQFVRPSIIPSLLSAEAVSGNAVYPHKVFEIGKTAFLCDEEVTGTRTRQYLGFLTAASDANFNGAASETASLLYFLNHEYTVEEASDPRFIPGRQARLIVKGKPVGIFGELHPAVLENWDIRVPCTAGELDLEALGTL
ncbi:phenylalanine--tRNA ligase subunit beta [Treponema sp. OMZ 840]|uniref:phenylalanine--tRNA ligase subunit beta n=1 Tax=Treponema sp. OMZ 840 TaxID=244313 RepID=UPI003D8ADB47